MKQHLDNAIAWLKGAKINNRPIEGCITGSCLLGEYYEHMDVDIFTYSSEEYINLLWLLHYDKNFLILDAKEQWKFDKNTSEPMYDAKNKGGVNSIKFMWNQIIPVNIIFKSHKKTIFDIVSSFDMDIVSRGYDLKTGMMLDLSNGSVETKIASPNIWNPQFSIVTIWSVWKFLRQIDRVIKYYKRGINTDPMVHKYISLIDKVIKEQNIFDSPKYGDMLNEAKADFKAVKGMLNVWLKTHEISEDEMKQLQLKIKQG